MGDRCMKKRMGFTLVELLAVIAILAILVIIALPNIIEMFNNAKKRFFYNEIRIVYNTAEETYIKDAFSNSGIKVYAKGEDGTKCAKELDMSDRDGFYYYISVDSSGKVNKIYIKDNNYQYVLEKEDIKKNDISFDDIKPLSEVENIIDITCDGILADTPSSDNGVTMFVSGKTLNKTMKKLSGQQNYNLDTFNNSITAFKRSTNSNVPNNAEVVSTENSKKTIYMWYQSGTIYYYSEDDKLYLNDNSSHMFYKLRSLSDIEGMNSLDTSRVVNMLAMFSVTTNLKSLEWKDSWDTSNVTNMSQMFTSSGITNMDLKKLNTEKVANMYYMFAGTEFSRIDLSNFNTKNLVDMGGIFSQNSNLVEIDLSSFDTSKVTDMSELFHGASNITNVIFGDNFNTSKVTDMGFMFAGAEKLESIDLSNFDTSNVTDMSYMFHGCKS